VSVKYRKRQLFSSYSQLRRINGLSADNVRPRACDQYTAETFVRLLGNSDHSDTQTIKKKRGILESPRRVQPTRRRPSKNSFTGSRRTAAGTARPPLKAHRLIAEHEPAKTPLLGACRRASRDARVCSHLNDSYRAVPAPAVHFTSNVRLWPF